MHSSLFRGSRLGNIFVQGARASTPCRRAPPEAPFSVRQFILRAGVFAALLALAGTANADPRVGAIGRVPEAARAIDPVPCPATAAPPWMIDTLLGAFVGPPGAASFEAAPPGTRAADAAAPLSKPHQNPAYPAAFVFQSNSALFLAVELDSARSRPEHTD